MRCPKCNKEIEDSSVFCEHCGEKILHAPTEAPGTENNGFEDGKEKIPTRKPKNKKIAIWIVTTVVLAIVIFIIILLSNMGGSVVEEMTDSTKVEACDEPSPSKHVLSESERQALLNIGYVDLGLPSGTLWKDQNENGYYTFNDAVFQYGNRLPTKENIDELVKYCKWTWGGWEPDTHYYKVTGPNGNSIIMPTSGLIHAKINNGEIYQNEDTGFIFASSQDDCPYYCLIFRRTKFDGVEQDYIKVFCGSGDESKYSVRLAQ